MHFDIYEKHPCCHLTLLFDQQSLGTIRFDIFPTLLEEKLKKSKFFFENFSKSQMKKSLKFFFQKFLPETHFLNVLTKSTKKLKIENFFRKFF